MSVGALRSSAAKPDIADLLARARAIGKPSRSSRIRWQWRKKGEFRRKRFNRVLDWAEDQQLIAAHEIEGITYLRLSRANTGDEGEAPEN